MNLKFSKKLIDTEFVLKQAKSKQIHLYNILDEKDQLICEFIYNEREQFLQVNNRKIRIKLIRKPFKSDKVHLIDHITQIQVGEIELLGNGINYAWEDVPSDPNAKISFDGAAYYFRRITPDVSSHFLKQDTWGHFKFRIYALKDDDYAVYSLKMDIPVWDKPNQSNSRPFSGAIETNFKNEIVISLAFYLFEIEFYYEDHKHDG